MKYGNKSRHPRNPHNAGNPACVGRMRFWFRYYHRRLREGREVKPQTRWGALGVYLVNCAKEALRGQVESDPLMLRRMSYRPDPCAGYDWQGFVRQSIQRRPLKPYDPRRLP